MLLEKEETNYLLCNIIVSLRWNFIFLFYSTRRYNHCKKCSFFTFYPTWILKLNPVRKSISVQSNSFVLFRQKPFELNLWDFKMFLACHHVLSGRHFCLFALCNAGKTNASCIKLNRHVTEQKNVFKMRYCIVSL
jgi:hypothetical protein